MSTGSFNRKSVPPAEIGLEQSRAGSGEEGVAGSVSKVINISRKK